MKRGDEKEAHTFSCLSGGLYKALEFVRNGGNADVPEINVGDNGWIPVTKRLPNEDEMKRAYCRNHYGSEFIVMIAGANRPTTLYRTMDGFWVDDKREIYSVVAWQALPELYTEEKREIV